MSSTVSIFTSSYSECLALSRRTSIINNSQIHQEELTGAFSELVLVWDVICAWHLNTVKCQMFKFLCCLKQCLSWLTLRSVIIRRKYFQCQISSWDNMFHYCYEYKSIFKRRTCIAFIHLVFCTHNSRLAYCFGIKGTIYSFIYPRQHLFKVHEFSS